MSEPLSLVLEKGIAELAGFEDPPLEARALLAGLLACSYSDLVLNRDKELDPQTVGRFHEMIARRKDREPVAYILGVKNFFGRDFQVNPFVLIPRPETELLVENALAELAKKRKSSPRVLDLCTGSGCVGVTMALERPDASVIASDISQRALTQASRNAERLEARNVRFYQSDIYKDLPSEFRGDFDMILANPPYVATPDISALEPDLEFEPRLALDAGVDGLSCIRPLVNGASSFLKEGGVLMFEIGSGQGEAVKEMLHAARLSSVDVKKDLNEHDRVAVAIK